MLSAAQHTLGYQPRDGGARTLPPANRPTEALANNPSQGKLAPDHATPVHQKGRVGESFAAHGKSDHHDRSGDPRPPSNTDSTSKLRTTGGPS